MQNAAQTVSPRDRPRPRRLFQPVECEKPIRGMCELRRATVIVMEHSAQDIAPFDRTVPRGAARSWHGTLLINALMGPRMVVVGGFCLTPRKGAFR
ncbi:MAG: hypothetical protein AVDCRST_MAG93-3481 [uncultured Chloroflexia bacterium]|uniref:Uncharacterized protein n=1 Tax=uncultured Chloroflexia bacterium TaxID=1672391 RepID=A0A6J4JR52_9CHLR|nr:MAG: hypothetical protein AVDCRST_MAG93-3481 [uncultured Chloroflexia bacterium]